MSREGGFSPKLLEVIAERDILQSKRAGRV